MSGKAEFLGLACPFWLSGLNQYYPLCRLVRYIGHLHAPNAPEDGASPDAVEGGAGVTSTRRVVEAEFAAGHVTAFADGYPITLASVASRRSLEETVGIPLDMSRFRPNVVVDGLQLAPYEEDMWLEVHVGNEQPLSLRSVKPCSRCAITTVDQDTGVVSPGQEPLKSLLRVRSGALLAETQDTFGSRPEWKRQGFFMWNMVAAGGGSLRVGDEVRIAARRLG
jgi:hypothetical protein